MTLKNREIKFRIWDKESKKMLPVSNIEYGYDSLDWGLFLKGIYAKGIKQKITKHNSSPFVRYGTEEKLARYDFEKNIFLMQYTGLKDSKGVEIYENDIVICENENEKSEVYFSQSEYCWKIKGWSSRSLFTERGNIKVIGNIFENKELLK